MNNLLKSTLSLGGGTILVGLLLWVLVAFGVSDLHRYLALVRAGLLVLGLGGCAWALLLQRVQMVLVSLLLLTFGLLSFYVSS